MEQTLCRVTVGNRRSACELDESTRTTSPKLRRTAEQTCLSLSSSSSFEAARIWVTKSMYSSAVARSAREDHELSPASQLLDSHDSPTVWNRLIPASR